MGQSDQPSSEIQPLTLDQGPNQELQPPFLEEQEMTEEDPNDNIEDTGSVEILVCETSHNIQSGSSWLKDINTLNINDLSFEIEPIEGLDATDSTKDKVEEEEISTAVNDVIDIHELLQYEILLDRPDEDDQVALRDASHDYLLNPIIEEEEDPYVRNDSDDMPTETSLNKQAHDKDQLIEDLAATLNPDWVISSSANVVRLLILSPFENVSVWKSISWNRKDIKIFVHNKELPKGHFLWNCFHLIDLEETNEISYLLSKIAYLVLNLKICRGVRLYSDLWQRVVEKKDGIVEDNFYQEVATLRDTKCSLLVTENICEACKKTSNILKHRNWRLTHEKEKDTSKVNLKYLTGEEAVARLRQAQEEKRKLQKVLCKLRKTVKRYVTAKNISISTDMSNDLASIFQTNYDLMTPVQKLFWGEQLKALAKQKNPRQMRWNPFIIKVAVHLQMLSSSAYRYMKNFVNLPSQRTLYDFTHYIDAKEGPQEQIIQEMHQKVKESCNQEHEKYFNLVFDEMDVRSDIVISRRTGDIVGYTYLSKVEEELAAFEAGILQGSDYQPQPAKKILVYMALGVTNSLRDIVAVYTTSGRLTTAQLYSRTWNTVYFMETHSLKVLSLICDGASTNKKIFRMHAKLDLCDFIYGTRNVACGEDRPIFFIPDPVHVLKSKRNNLANSFSHKKTRKMWKNGEVLSWNVLKTLQSITQKFKYKDIKLTKAHVKLSSRSCMKVIYAAQVMSNSVVKALKVFQNDPSLINHDLDELLTFLKLVNDWFDCLNGSDDPKGKRNKENDLLHPYTDIFDKRFEFLEKEYLGFFDKWLEDVMNRRGNFSKAREKMFISTQTYESARMTTMGFINAVKFMLKNGAPCVEAKKFNQDKVEQFFGLLRMSFGANTNPSTSEVLQKVVTLHVQGEAAKPPSKGNTQVTPQEWIPDQSELQRRPTERK